MDFQEHLDHGAGARRVGSPLVTCAQCGCRLRQDDTESMQEQWLHFAPIGGRDARGCRIACADAPHDRLGSPLVVLA